MGDHPVRRGAPSAERRQATVSRLGRLLTVDQILQLMERRAKNAPSQIERRIRSELQQTFEGILRDPELVEFIRDQEAAREKRAPPLEIGYDQTGSD